MKISSRLIFATLAATAALAGCTKEITPDFENDKVNPAAEGSRVIAVSFAPGTKTTLEEGLQPKFADGDSILISNGEALDTCEVKVDDKGATITTHLTGPLNAVYPAKAAKMNETNKNQIDTVLVSTEQDGTFASANICMAENIPEDAKEVTFVNQTAVFRIIPVAGKSAQCVEIRAEGFSIANNIPTGSAITDFSTIHVAPITTDTVYVSILVPENLTVGKLTFSDGTNEKTVTTGDRVDEKIAAGTIYTVTNENWESPAPDIPDGALNGKFSVSAGKQVLFSQGNLYYDGADWGFESEQYYFRTYCDGTNEGGKCNADGYNTSSSTANGHWGLFGWVGASSSFASSPEIYGVTTSTKGSDYGNVPGEVLKADWGKAIDNNDTWRTLSRDEWGYLFGMGLSDEDGYYVPKEGHPRADKWGLATVNGVPGLVLLPDSWNLPSECVFTPTALDERCDVSDGENFNLNIYTIGQWGLMESAGAVFLPAAGSRKGSDVEDVGVNGWYWSSFSSAGTDLLTYSVAFSSDKVYSDFYESGNRYFGSSVRLVTNVSEAPAPVAAPAPRRGNDTLVIIHKYVFDVDTARIADFPVKMETVIPTGVNVKDSARTIIGNSLIDATFAPKVEIAVPDGKNASIEVDNKVVIPQKK